MGDTFSSAPLVGLLVVLISLLGGFRQERVSPVDTIVPLAMDAKENVATTVCSRACGPSTNLGGTVIR